MSHLGSSVHMSGLLWVCHTYQLLSVMKHDEIKKHVFLISMYSI
jgi:hypothetical protein